MLSEISSTYVYQRALAATRTAPYTSINLNHVITELSEALKLVHAGGFFAEYTRHGPEHSIALVQSLDWLVADEQRDQLSDGDYLFLLLSCLIHDLGMLTNREEFQHRNIDEIAKFKQRLAAETGGREFLGSIPSLFPFREELIFEEFIRLSHAKRVSAALNGVTDPSLGDTSRIALLFHTLFSELNPKVISDLALVCESHHSSDLHDLKRYPTKAVHGQSAPAQVNIHAVCLLLRAADILQIGTGRTPSVAFSLVSPSNPISYLHWTKEMGVTRVTGDIQRSKDPLTIPDQYRVKVYGFFKDAEPFFALMNHVKYATAELRRCVTWSAQASKGDTDFRFRWTAVDTADVEAHGFEREQFSFQIDREKILNLLIGHTLYNDTRVVLRELVQNSLDAVRLNKYITGSTGTVKATLFPEARKLTVVDSGTGMTSEIITKHLLTVGSSFYNTEEFSRDNPDFSPISRFGIGILTSFMIADEIEILTSHSSESFARRISINGPSGTYLIKLIDKKDIATSFNGSGHGTAINLTIRANSKRIRLIEELTYWFGFPGCKLEGQEGDDAAVQIGYSHPADMLSDGLQKYLARDAAAQRYYTYEVVRHDVPGYLEAAFISRTSKYSGRAALVQTAEMSRRSAEDVDLPSRAGIFLQGVRVETGSAGFRGDGPLAVVNGLGKSVPRTNVARSGIEQGDSQRRFLSAIYSTYITYARSQLSEGNRAPISVTSEGRAAFYSLTQFDAERAADRDVLQTELDNEKVIVVEDAGVRRLTSRSEFVTFPQFNTVDSPFYRNAEALIEKLPHSRSLKDVMAALQLGDIPTGSGVILCAPSLHLSAREMSTLTLETVRFSSSEQQLLLTWKRVEEANPGEMLLRYFAIVQAPYESATPIILVREDALSEGSDWSPETLLITEYCVLVHPRSSVSAHLRAVFDPVGDGGTANRFEANAIRMSLIEIITRSRYGTHRGVDELARENSQRHPDISVERVKAAVAPYDGLARLEVAREDMN